jgi:cell division protein FtsL
MEQKMSKRLFTSAIVATLMMAGVSIYSALYQNGSETASILTMMGG